MKRVWVGLAAGFVAPMVAAQATIYKHVDATGRVTYANRPMSGAVVVELEPLSTVPGLPRSAIAPASPMPAPQDPPTARTGPPPPVAVVRPLPLPPPAQTEHAPVADRNAERRARVRNALTEEEEALAEVRKLLLQEQRNPELIAAVRRAQDASQPTPAQQAEIRANIDKASGRIRGLQSTAAEHEKKIEALKKELDGLKS
jgi:hypothetical protein